MIRAAVRRDGPSEWSWALRDDHGDLIVGLAETWEQALAEANRELTACWPAGLAAEDRLDVDGIELGDAPFSVLGSAVLWHDPVDVTPAPLRESRWRRWLGL